MSAALDVLFGVTLTLFKDGEEIVSSKKIDFVGGFWSVFYNAETGRVELGVAGLTFDNLENIASCSILGNPTAAGAAPSAIVVAPNQFLARSSTNYLEAKAISDFAFTLLDDADAAAVRTTLGLVIGTNVQAYDSTLAGIAAVTGAADKGLYFTGADVAGLFDLTAAGRALLDDADAAAQRATLGLVIGTNVQAYDATLAGIAAVTGAADKGLYFTGADVAGLFDLTAFGRSLVDDADASAARTTLGLGTMATQAASGVAITGGTIDSAVNRTASSVSEDVASTAASSNIDIALAASTSYTFVVQARAESATPTRCTVRAVVDAVRSGSAAPTTSGATIVFQSGSGLSISATISGNNLRISVTNTMGADCHMTIRIWNPEQDATVEDS